MKISEKVQTYIDILNTELKEFTNRNPDIIFNEVVNVEYEDYTEGSLKFDSFTVLFRCHKGGSGYSFMEVPVTEKDNPLFLTKITYEALFKFDFSEIPFSVYDIHNVVNDQNFKTLCFHDITTEEEAVYAVSEILNFITKNISSINAVANDSNLQTALTNNYFHDEKVFDEKFSVDSFNEDIETNAYLHEATSNTHLAIQDGVYRFLTTGSYRLLVKEFNKAKKKNNLTVFEERYEKFLYDNNFENTDEITTKKLKSAKNTRFYSGIIYTALIFVSGGLAILINLLLSKICISKFYADSLFLGTTKSGLEIVLLVLSILLILRVLVSKIPVIKDKIGRRVLDKKYNKAIVSVGVILMAVSIFSTVFTYKNNGIAIKENTVYVENTAVNPKDGDIEFILIRGTEYTDENNKLVYESDIEDRQLLYVLHGDYYNYLYCELLESDGYVTNQIINELKKANCKVSSYRTIEDFAEKHGFEIDE